MRSCASPRWLGTWGRIDPSGGKTHLTVMNMHTKLSGKGQVVVPKALRDRKGWLPGTDLEVVETAEGVLLRNRSPRKKLTVDEAVARFHKIYTHQGPPVTLAEMDEAIAEAVAERDARRRK